MKDLETRIQRNNAKAAADRKAMQDLADRAEERAAMRSYGGLMQCERCHTEQDDAPECRVCGMESF